MKKWARSAVKDAMVPIAGFKKRKAGIAVWQPAFFLDPHARNWHCFPVRKGMTIDH